MSRGRFVRRAVLSAAVALSVAMVPNPAAAAVSKVRLHSPASVVHAGKALKLTARVPSTDASVTFVTQKPGAVAWPGGGLQAPHLLVGVFARGLLKRLVTRMYFPDEVEANANDPVLSRLPAGARETLIARPDADGLLFDIVIQGPGETTFFAV